MTDAGPPEGHPAGPETGPETDDAANALTLHSYQQRVAEYTRGTAAVTSGAVKAWIDAALDGLSPHARLLEVGSAFGRDAAYIVSRGFALECSDAVPGFVAQLRARGFTARPFNLLHDELAPGYQLILANAVLLHLTRQQFPPAVARLRRALVPGGRLAFSLKQGRGEGWSEEKIGAPRFFCYWEPDRVAPVLQAAGFASWTIEAVHTARTHAQWLFVIAQTPAAA